MGRTYKDSRKHMARPNTREYWLERSELIDHYKVLAEEERTLARHGTSTVASNNRSMEDNVNAIEKD